MMEYRVIIFAFAALFCQVQSRCFAPDVEVITCPPIVPTTPIVVDNSVSIALANALQLLIVKDIIESNLGASCLPNLLPIETLCGCTEICYPNIGCAPNCYPYGAEILPTCGCSPVVTIPPYNNGCYKCCNDLVTPIPYNSNLCAPCLPNLLPIDTCGCTEICYPNCYPIFNQCLPTCGCPVTIPPCNNGCYRGYNELVTPIPYNSCGDIWPCNTCGTPETICVCGQYCTGPEIITPNCNCGCYANPCNTYSVTEFIPPCYPGCGVPEVIQPCLPYYNGCPEVISPIYKPGCVEPVPWGWPGCRDIVPPCNPWCSGCDFCGPSPGCIPNCCDTPVAAEVLIPPCIPAQLNCNFGCTPTLGPCINFNVEPLPCGCGYCY
ncbi:uncharacterized protein [Maniola hyperantus]|uniref:uncharacterized protein n=1 Tax=Aphantopus hyperantus TaxID=2795564 RepID=UPI0037494646